MPHRCVHKPFNWLAWNFVHLKGMDYEDAEVEVQYKYCECDPHGHIRRHHIMQVHIKADEHVDVVRCNLSFPREIKLVQVFIVYPVWMGRGWRCVEYPLCTAFNPSADGYYMIKGNFSY